MPGPKGLESSQSPHPALGLDITATRIYYLRTYPIACFARLNLRARPERVLTVIFNQEIIDEKADTEFCY